MLAGEFASGLVIASMSVCVYACMLRVEASVKLLRCRESETFLGSDAVYADFYFSDSWCNTSQHNPERHSELCYEEMDQYRLQKPAQYVSDQHAIMNDRPKPRLTFNRLTY